MRRINNYIVEKLHLDKDTKIKRDVYVNDNAILITFMNAPNNNDIMLKNIYIKTIDNKDGILYFILDEDGKITGSKGWESYKTNSLGYKEYINNYYIRLILQDETAILNFCDDIINASKSSGMLKEFPFDKWIDSFKKINLDKVSISSSTLADFKILKRNLEK